MIPSTACFDLIKSFEQFRPTAYLPTKHDVPTLGYGHTAGVRMTDTCTMPTAETWLRQDVGAVVSDINNRCQGVPLTQNQFDALVSLVFNIGITAFDGSTLLKRLREWPRFAPGMRSTLWTSNCAHEFTRWNKQAGRVLAGLTARRAKEAALFAA